MNAVANHRVGRIRDRFSMALPLPVAGRAVSRTLGSDHEPQAHEDSRTALGTHCSPGWQC
jgi:hypothetical protein